MAEGWGLGAGLRSRAEAGGDLGITSCLSSRLLHLNVRQQHELSVEVSYRRHLAKRVGCHSQRS